jgi:hypothetical protein
MRVYKAPNEEMKLFLVETIKKLTGLEKLQTQELAKLLIEKSGKKSKYNSNNVGDQFSWLHKIGVLDFEQHYVKSGGWRLFLFRSCGESEVESLIMGGEQVSIPESGTDEKPAENPAKTVDAVMTEAPREPKKKRKKPGKSKKPGASASPCCDNPHPVKSRKTGKRRCKNCNTPLPPKKKKAQHET